MLSNLLQELTVAKDYGRKHIILDEARLSENPVSRLSRLIKGTFWNALTRRIDGSNIEVPPVIAPTRSAGPDTLRRRSSLETFDRVPRGLNIETNPRRSVHAGIYERRE